MSSSRIFRLSEIKSHYMLSVLRYLVQRGHMSRAELVLAIGCNATTVSRATRELLGRGLLFSSGNTAVGHGRPRENLCLDSARYSNLGLAFDRKEITAVRTTLRGEIKGTVTRQLPSCCSREDFVGALTATARGLLDQAEGRLTGVGIAAIGTVTDDGVLRNVTHFPELDGLPLKQICEQAFGTQPLIGDTLLCQLQRHLFSEGGRQKNTLYIVADSKIGLVMALDGRVIGKHQHHVGEFGHISCEPDGLPCSCGRRGCLVTRCSTEALTARLRHRFNHDVDFPDVFQLARNRHELVMLEVTSVARLLGTAIANQVNNLYPDHLVITGQLPALGKDFQDVLISTIRGQLFPRAAGGLEIDFLETGHTTSATGAALLVTAKLLEDITFLDQVCPPQPSCD